MVGGKVSASLIVRPGAYLANFFNMIRHLLFILDSFWDTVPIKLMGDGGKIYYVEGVTAQNKNAFDAYGANAANSGWYESILVLLVT